MSEEISTHFIGRVSVWKGEQGTAESEAVVPVQITDLEGDLVEVSFDTHKGARRTCLLFNRAVTAYDAE